MTLQEKIDKLPLSIDAAGITYNLEIRSGYGDIAIGYISPYKSYLFYVYDENIAFKTSVRLEQVIDDVLTIIENKDWLDNNYHCLRLTRL